MNHNGIDIYSGKKRSYATFFGIILDNMSVN